MNELSTSNNIGMLFGINKGIARGGLYYDVLVNINGVEYEVSYCYGSGEPWTDLGVLLRTLNKIGFNVSKDALKFISIFNVVKDYNSLYLTHSTNAN